jgi:predicted PurR-regulated permease PerM
LIDKEIKWPFYAKATTCFIGLFALLAMMYIGKRIIVPLVFAILIAILLHPVVNFFVKRKVNRLIAIFISLFLAFLIIVLFGFLLVSQTSKFSQSWPVLVDKFTDLLNQSITWASKYFELDPKNIHNWITNSIDDLIDTSTGAIEQTLITVGSSLVVLFLVPAYVFMIMYYQPLLIEFLHTVFGKDDQKQVSEVISQTKKVIQGYLIGLFIEAVIIATLNSTALLILGIDYAILLGIIGALLNVIPYIGGIVAVALPMIVAFATKSSGWYTVYVFAGYYFIQLIDNHYISPFIVSSKVKINALFSIISVLVGYALWGIPGMFLSIPLLAIIKLIFDHIEPLKPWGFLLGDTMPPIIKLKPLKILKIKRSKVEII